MINGEDYNIYPLTKFTSIIKSKAINRTSSGISRFLDVKDSTGKYSSQIFSAKMECCIDKSHPRKIHLHPNNDNDIINVIKNIVEKNIASKPNVSFSFEKLCC